MPPRRRPARGVAHAATRTRVSLGQRTALLAVYTTLGAWIAAILLNIVGIDWWWITIAGMLATAVLRITLNQRLMLSWLRAWATGGALFATAWLSYAVATTPLSSTSGGSLLLVVLWWSGWHYWLHSPETRRASPLRRIPAEPPSTPERVECARWQRAMAQVGISWVTVEEVLDQEHELVLRCTIQPGKGRSVQAVRTATPDLEVAFYVRTGAVRVQRGTGAAEVSIHISTRDIFASLIKLPPDTGDLDINHPLPLGLYEDGTPTELLFRERCLGVFGMRGGGKTNFLDVCTCMISRTDNAVQWVSDIAKGSQFIRPWMRPFLAGTVNRSPFDYCAVTEEETAAMLIEAYLFIDLRCRAADDKHIPTRDAPAIFITIEEYTTLVSSKRKITTHDGKVWTFDQLILEIIRLGRGAAIDVILTAQRATTSMTGRNSGGDIKSQLDVKVGLKCATRMDVSYVFGECPHINPAEFNHKGMMLIQDMDSPVLASKSFRVNRDGIEDIVIETNDRRPTLESHLVNSPKSRFYRTRWSAERTQELRLRVLNKHQPEPQTQEEDHPMIDDQPVTPPSLRLISTHEKDMPMQNSMADMAQEQMAALDSKLEENQPDHFRVMQLIRAARARGEQDPVAAARADRAAELAAAQSGPASLTGAPETDPGTGQDAGGTLAEHILTIIGQATGSISRKGICARLTELGVPHSPGGVANLLTALTRAEKVDRAEHGQYVPKVNVA